MMLDSSGDSGDPWGGSFCRRLRDPGDHDPRLDVGADQPQQSLVANLARNPVHQLVVVDRVKEVLQVNIDHPSVAVRQVAPGRFHGLVGATPRTEPEA